MLLDAETLRNNHLRDIIHQIQNSENENINDKLITRLCQELNVGCFITPICGAGILRMPHKENSSVVPIFTSLNEYNIDFDGAEILPFSWKFKFIN